MWTVPAAAAVFGDVFRADFLLDVHVRADAVTLGEAQLSARQVRQLATLGVPPTGSVDIYSPAFSDSTGFVLARATGASGTAMLVSDSCAVATALVQGRQKRSVGGRLLFVPVLVDPPPAVWERLRKRTDFGRLALDPHAAWPDGAIAELRLCFMVDARDVKVNLDARIATLSPAGADELAARWAAFATRRGPIAYEQSAAKLGHVLAARAGVAVGDQHVAVGDEVARTLDLAWTLEGGDLEEVVDRYAAHAVGELLPADTDAILDATVAKLRDLAAQATVAADAIEVSR